MTIKRLWRRCSRWVNAKPAGTKRDRLGKVETDLGGKLDLDAVAAGADFEIDAAQPGMPPERRHHARDRPIRILDQCDIVWTDIKPRWAARNVASFEVERGSVEPDPALLDVDRE